MKHLLKPQGTLESTTTTLGLPDAAPQNDNMDDTTNIASGNPFRRAPSPRPSTRPAFFSSFKARVIAGLAILAGLFLLYRLICVAGWLWPYNAASEYLKERLPLAAPWMIESAALLLCALVVAQAGAILSFVFFGRHKKTMLYLVIAGAAAHAAIGWYSYPRVAVDARGKVRVRVVERPDGSLKILDREFDPETVRPARRATENDLVMLDLQRRGLSVERVGPRGPFRSPQGTIIVYYTRKDGQILFYTGPRHREVSGDMPLATEDVLREFAQRNGQRAR